MRINKKTRYTIDILIYLHENRERGYIMLKDACESKFISIEHGRKVIQMLKKFNYIESKQGINGGIKLCVEPHDVDFFKIIMITENIDEDNFNPDCCQDCPDLQECKFMKIVYGRMQSMLESFKGVTLIDFL